LQTKRIRPLKTEIEGLHPEMGGERFRVIC
jgi:hypothetical protein